MWIVESVIVVGVWCRACGYVGLGGGWVALGLRGGPVDLVLRGNQEGGKGNQKPTTENETDYETKTKPPLEWYVLLLQAPGGLALEAVLGAGAAPRDGNLSTQFPKEIPEPQNRGVPQEPISKIG